MNLNSLIENLNYNKPYGVFNYLKRLFWVYNLSKKMGLNVAHLNISYKYPAPIGKIKLRVRNNKGADSFILGEVFDQETYNISYTPDVKYIVDLGANAGFTAVYYSKLFREATIACVEPIQANIEILKKNIAKNNVNAIVIEAAISTDDQEIEMEISDLDYGHKVHNLPFGKKISNKTIMVEGLCMNSLIKKLAWPTIDLLKIDIEGFEGCLFAQNTEWLKITNTIIMEIHEKVSIREITKVTRSYAFKYLIQRKGNWILSKTQIL